MTAENIAADYVSAPEIADESGVALNTVHNWLKYHGYMAHEKILGRRVVRRTEFERFKLEHPELVKAKSEVTP